VQDYQAKSARIFVYKTLEKKLNRTHSLEFLAFFFFWKHIDARISSRKVEKKEGRKQWQMCNEHCEQRDQTAGPRGWRILLTKSFEGLSSSRLGESLFCFRKCHMKNAFGLQMPALCMAKSPFLPSLPPLSSFFVLRGCRNPPAMGTCLARNFHLMCLRKVLKGNDD